MTVYTLEIGVIYDSSLAHELTDSLSNKFLLNGLPNAPMINKLQKDNYNLNLTNDMNISNEYKILKPNIYKITDSNDYQKLDNNNLIEKKIDIIKDLELLNEIFETDSSIEKEKKKYKKNKNPYKFTY